MDSNSPEIKNFARSKRVKKVLLIIAIIVGVLLVFQAGMIAGYHRAAFSYQFGNNYQQTFGMHRGAFPGGGMMGVFGGEFFDAHGSTGKIISITLPTMMIADRDGAEKVVVLRDDTNIRQLRDDISADQLKVGDILVVIGSPNDKAQIEAKFIRLLPQTTVPFSGTGTPAR